MTRIAYLGPEGTFTEAALRQMVGRRTGAAVDRRHQPVAGRKRRRRRSQRFASHDADYACVPIENSIEGSVLPTLDSLATGTPLQIFAELTLDVSFTIVVRPGTDAAAVKSVAAFPVAAAQVANWAGDASTRRRGVQAADSNAAAARRRRRRAAPMRA